MSKTMVDRHWRTRKDPFESVWPEAEEMLEVMPELDGVTLFRYFQESYPDRFEEGQLRTLQRQVSSWKAVNGPEREIFFNQKQVPGKVMQLDWMHDKLSVTVEGRPFDHLLCHCVLPFSNWEHAHICFSENLLSLRLTLQSALFDLGYRPEMLQIDNSSAATHQLGNGSDHRGFTEKFQSVLKHFELKGRTINVGKANENGAVESAHGHLRRRLKQALMLRGSRNFSSQEEYEAFVTMQIGRANRLRTTRFREELVVMTKVNVSALTSYDEETHRIGSGSTVRICKRVYSVPSRLVGRRLNCRIYLERIDLFDGSTRVHSMERVYEGDSINWRDLVHSMVRKPGALANYNYRDAFFPSEMFVALCDRLKADLGDWQGHVAYLQALSMCRDFDNSAIEGAVGRLLKTTERVTLEGLRDAVGITPREVTLQAFEPDLSGYDSFCQEVSCG
jgi:transposase